MPKAKSTRRVSSKKGASKAGGGKGRRRAGEDLRSVLVEVLRAAKQPMSIAETASAAKKAGYKTSSPSFARIVGLRLSVDKSFKRASRGMYTLAKKK